jgi:hypothetical protein
MMEDKEPIEPHFYSRYDHGQQLDFEGYHLANSSSYITGKPRWFVLDIYKTIGGKYIVSGMGMSLVVHRANCNQMKEKNVILQPAIYNSIACSFCSPDLHEDVAHEINREWTQVSDSPQAIIEKLRLRDGKEGIWYIPRTSMIAILEATENDEKFHEAFFTPQRIE